MSDLDDLEGGDSPIAASPTKIKRGGLILKLLFLLYWQNLAAFVLTLILIFFALFVFTMKLPSKAEFIRFPLFLLLNLFLTFLMVYELVFVLERMSVSRWTPAFYFLFDMKRGLFCFMYSTSNYGDIQETDLLTVMSKEDVAQLLKLLEADGTKTITQTSLKNWIDTICKKREDLVHLLTHTSAAIKDLNDIIDMSMFPILTPLWFLFAGFKTRVLLTVLGLSATWLTLCVPTSKIIQDGVLSAFRRRQFDIGDYCIIDNQEMVVQDLGIFETIFINQKNKTTTLSYTALATKSIQNITRSSVWSETFEFSVKAPRKLHRKLKKFESKLDGFLKRKPDIWSEGHSLFFKEIAKSGSKYTLEVIHSTKFQNLQLNKIQRSELLFQVRRIFQEVDIECLSLN